MAKVVVPVVAATTLALVLWWAVESLDPDGVGFALVIVWAPMTALGSVSHVLPVRLPEGFHRLRSFELDGRVYERLGVRAAKRLARRGPISWCNPGLHVPRERDAASLERLEMKMCEAEASHALLFVAGLATAAVLAGLGYSTGAAWVVVFDVFLNGYPLMLQRYNRARLAQRFVVGGGGRGGGRGGRGHGERTFAAAPPITMSDGHPQGDGSAGPVPVAEGATPDGPPNPDPRKQPGSGCVGHNLQ
jgi:hypothetical protein